MALSDRYPQYGTVFEKWQIREKLGGGQHGKSAVFKLSRIDNESQTAALKSIALIESEGHYDALSGEWQTAYEEARTACREEAEGEVRVMDSLRGFPNVVDYQEHCFVDWEDEHGYGRDMLILMELLTDLRKEIKAGRPFDRNELIRIGEDICCALSVCHQNGIIHRDIKPENIFIRKDASGQAACYKLGDFGIARIVIEAPGSMASTNVGTPQYAAPEQFTTRHDKRVDIYSLGLVLYEMSNEMRLPFAESPFVTNAEIIKRNNGTPLPKPSQADDELARVILKACAFLPDDRYQTAEELRSALHDLQQTGVAAEKQTYTAPEGVGPDNGYDTLRAEPANAAPIEPAAPAPKPPVTVPEPVAQPGRIVAETPPAPAPKAEEKPAEAPQQLQEPEVPLASAHEEESAAGFNAQSFGRRAPKFMTQVLKQPSASNSASKPAPAVQAASQLQPKPVPNARQAAVEQEETVETPSEKTGKGKPSASSFLLGLLRGGKKKRADQEKETSGQLQPEKEPENAPAGEVDDECTVNDLAEATIDSFSTLHISLDIHSAVGNQHREVDLREEAMFVIGRSNSAEQPNLGLNSKMISRRHCALFLEGGMPCVCDLMSHNGTSVDGHPLRTPVQQPSLDAYRRYGILLTNGSKIVLGRNEYIITVRW